MEATMAASKLPDIDFVRECLDYDPDTGVFRWRERPPSHFLNGEFGRGWRSWNAKWAGKSAGATHNGARGKVYWTIRLASAPILAHRLAWLMMRGDPGEFEIDHIDGDPMNNRITNLRLATRSQQSANSKRYSRGTYTGIKGVTPNSSSKGYDARIRVKGKTHYIGHFRTIEEAAEARRKAAIDLHGEFHRSD
jgi:hypothetical protein